LVQGRTSPGAKSFPRGGWGDNTPKKKGKGADRIQPEKIEPETIVLRDGTPSGGPVAYAGSVRIQAMPLAKTKKDDLFAVLIEAIAEPRLLEFRVLRVSIDKAIDDEGQTLDFFADYEDEARKGNGSISINGRTFRPRPPAVQDRTTTAALKKGQKTGKSLREL